MPPTPQAIHSPAFVAAPPTAGTDDASPRFTQGMMAMAGAMPPNQSTPELTSPSQEPLSKRTNFAVLFLAVFFVALLIGAGAFAIYHFLVVVRGPHSRAPHLESTRPGFVTMVRE
jgi:hypothetical protein